jgi:hypothetical protein
LIFILFVDKKKSCVYNYTFTLNIYNALEIWTVIPSVAIDQLNKGVYNFMFRTNYPDFACPNPFQPVADFTTGITTTFVLERG